MNDTNTLMLEGFRAFLEMAQQLREEREEEIEASFKIDEEHPELYSEEGDLEDSEGEDFPYRKAFVIPTDFDDPRWARGVDMGMPTSLLVRSDDSEGKLLPIRHGLFVDPYSEG